MILTPSQVALLLREAGFDPFTSVTALAIAHAESNLNDQAIGDVSLEDDVWGPSIGLWQIRTLKRALPGTLRDANWLLSDPLNQAKAAFTISDAGSNFTPWSTYKSGAYHQYLSEAVSAVKGLPLPINQPNQPYIAAAFPFESGYVLVSSDGAVYAFNCQYHGGLSWNGTSWVAVGQQ